MRIHDSLTGLATLVVGTVVAIAAWQFPPAPGQAFGPGGFPLLIGAALVICGLMLVGAGRGERTTPLLTLRTDSAQPHALRNLSLVLGGVTFFALVIDVAGFFLTAVTLLVVLFAAFGVPRRWIVPLAAGITLLLHVIFYTLLRVPLPWGWLEGFAW
jgi:putative tricarboxylic transport membrane protein